MYPRKMPKKFYQKTLFLGYSLKFQGQEVKYWAKYFSKFYFQNLISEFYFQNFNDYEIFWNGSFDSCLLQFWSNCNFECRLPVVAASFAEELREHFVISDCELFARGWLVLPTTVFCYESHPLLGWSKMVSVALDLHASPLNLVSLPPAQWWSRMTSKELLNWLCSCWDWFLVSRESYRRVVNEMFEIWKLFIPDKHYGITSS